MESMRWLADKLQEAAHDNLISATVYGTASCQEWSKSITHLVIVLKTTHYDALADLTPCLREATRRMRIEPYILRESDPKTMLDTLPLKALMVRIHGQVLVGSNPFLALQIMPSDVRLRVEQESRNLLIRLRHDLVLSPSDGHLLRSGLWRTKRGIERILTGMAFVKGVATAPALALWRDAQKLWNLPPEGLNALSEYGQQTTDTHLTPIASSVLDLLERLVDEVDRLEV